MDIVQTQLETKSVGSIQPSTHFRSGAHDANPVVRNRTVDRGHSKQHSSRAVYHTRNEPKASTQVHYLYPKLAQFLSTRGMESIYDEIYPYVLNSMNSGNSYLSPPALLALCDTLPLPAPTKQALQFALRTHCVDEQLLVDLDEQQLLPYFRPDLLQALTMLRAAVLAHAGYWSANPIVCPPGTHPMAHAGLATDLTLIPEHQAHAVAAADCRAAATGEGLVYGQLMVLGYTEKHWVNRDSFDVGSANSSLLLRRRTVAGHLHHTASAKHDPLRDVFQIGRADGNDLVLRGNLHFAAPVSATASGGNTSASRGLCGPLSRFAARVVCDRLPPFAARVYAAGVDEQGELVLGGAAPRVPPAVPASAATAAHQSGYPHPQHFTQYTHTQAQVPYATPTAAADWLTSCGMRLWRPDTRTWVEISVCGQAFFPRESLTRAGASMPPPAQLFDGSCPEPDWRWNKLCDGCILDLAGTYVLYQSAAAMACTVFTPPAEVLGKLHALRPSCPVLLQGVKFTHQTDAERMLAQLRAVEASGHSYVSRLRAPRIPIGAVAVGGGAQAEDAVRAMVCVCADVCHIKFPKV